LPFLVERFEDVYILDGNSTDGTIEFARSLGVRIEKQFETDEPNQRISDFRAMRLRLWSLATFDWLFILDSDEEVTPECMEVVEGVLASNPRGEAHSFCLLMQLPDGRIAREASFYPNRCIRLFRRSDGISLVDRKLHERFLVPDNVKTILHDEGITSVWLPPKAYLKKTFRYLKIESESTFPSNIAYLLRWIIYFNIRSFIGQTARALLSYARALVFDFKVTEGFF
jgi:glycosyltransferase involved in cell wall biosynthesis